MYSQITSVDALMVLRDSHCPTIIAPKVQGGCVMQTTLLAALRYLSRLRVLTYRVEMTCAARSFRGFSVIGLGRLAVLWNRVVQLMCGHTETLTQLLARAVGNVLKFQPSYNLDKTVVRKTDVFTILYTHSHLAKTASR